MKRLRAALVAVILAAGMVTSAAPAEATAASLIVHNSEHSESALWMINTNGGGWSLGIGQTANNRAGASNADVKGYYIGSGWCARIYVYRLDTSQGWIYLGTTGPGYHYPLNQAARMHGVETHRAIYGGPHGCG